MARAFFGPPAGQPVSGGAQITLHLVPVLAGRLVIFEVTAREVRGRWLPWEVLEFGANPWAAAAALADDWCDVPLRDLSLADVLSLTPAGTGWELALVFRAELEALPAGDAERHPMLQAEGAFDAIGAFDPIDLERWVRMRPAEANDAASGRLVF